MPVNASNEWSGVRADQIARIEIGGTPSRNIPRYWADGNEGHPWVSIADMLQTSIETTSERITDAGVRFSNVKLVPTGTPLMSFKLTVGRVAVAGRDLYTNEAIAAFFVKADQADPRWLVHALPAACARAITDTAVKGLTLNKAKLERLTFDLPSLLEHSADRSG
jgi:type I restriction enzyme S subunit